ncbi:16 kDa calcium-binding protein-like [Tubulanus polymorphus]|uniref:16 kDa calcium-binding protein-like n=1 Tax=Tubulanus polymorphus TaxID=672921 RepID=UPI003DA29A0D
MQQDYGDVFEPIIDEYKIGEEYKDSLNRVIEKFVIKYDADGNGRVSKEEMSAIIKSPKYLEHLFKTYDHDGDGLSLDEYLEDWFTKKVIKHWRNVFQEYDIDGSGDLKGEEIDPYLASLNVFGSRARLVKNKLDADKDGKISFKEFENYAKVELREKLAEKCEIFHKLRADKALTREKDLEANKPVYNTGGMFKQ